jgi:hypothetical protein
MSVFTNRASRSVEQAKAYTAAILDLLGPRDPMDVLKTTAAALRRELADSDLVWGCRVRMVLAHDRPPLTGYDQDLWAERLRYDEADAHQALEEFQLLRRANLRLLQRAAPQDLKRVGVHAERGEESVDHMVRMYAGHDLLHLKQIERIRKAVAGGQ